MDQRKRPASNSQISEQVHELMKRQKQIFRGILQAKIAAVRMPQMATAKKPPSAPRVYRPQPMPRCLQMKKNDARGIASANRKTPEPPPLYRPNAIPKCLQKKSSHSESPKSFIQRQMPKAPSSYQPNPIPRCVQPKQIPMAQSRASIKSKAANRLATERTIQRKVGFEFEMGQAISWSSSAKRLEKRDRMLTGVGFYLEADDQGELSDSEFVVEAVEETPDGEQRLRSAIKKMVKITEKIERLLKSKYERNKAVPTSELTEFGTVPTLTWIQLRRGGWGAQVQATAGIKLSSLDKAFKDLSDVPDLPAIDIWEVKKEKERNDDSPLLKAKVEGSQRWFGEEDTQAGKIRKAAKRIIAETFKGRHPSLTGLITILAVYLVRGAGGSSSYAKKISGPLMARTDFATIFSLLPQSQKDYFRAHPDSFVSLVTSVARTADTETVPVERDRQEKEKEEEITVQAVKRANEYSSTDPVLKGGIYTNDPHPSGGRAPDVSGLTVGDWLRGIVGPPTNPWLPTMLVGQAKGVDKLTAKHFPGTKAAKEEIESMGSYGARTDASAPAMNGRYLFGKGTPRPIFEYRGLKTLGPDEWEDFAVDFLRYIRKINQPGKSGKEKID